MKTTKQQCSYLLLLLQLVLAAVASANMYPPTPAGPCPYPGGCGSYGICFDGHYCSCPRDASNRMVNYFLPVNDRHPELGCSPVVPITCRSLKNHWLLKVEDIRFSYTKNPGTSLPGSWSTSRCKAACLSSCSCRAVLFQYGSDEMNGSCYLMKEVVYLQVHDKEATPYNSTIFIKVQVQ